MATIVRLPKLGLSDRGEIVEWRVQPGDEVADEDVIAILESDKSAVDIQATADGVLLETYVDEGEELEIEPGRPIAAIGDSGESPPTLAELDGGDGGTVQTDDAASSSDDATDAGSTASTSSERKVSPKARKLAAEADVEVPLDDLPGTGPDGAVVAADVKGAIDDGMMADSSTTAAATGSSESATVEAKATVAATPKAKRLAQSEDVDLSTVTGTGPQGAVTVADIEARTHDGGGAPQEAPAASHRDDEYVAGTVHELSRTERTVAERLTRSAQEKPHVRGDRTVNIERLERVSDELRTRGEGPSVNDLLFRAIVRTLEAHPEVNAIYENDQYKLMDTIDVGYAVDTDDGLLVPVVPDAGGKSLEELSSARQAVVSRVLEGSHSPSDLQGGTFTVTNVGALGLDSAFSIINPPQVAILVIGRRKPALFETADGIETAMGITLSLLIDHRVLDGGDAGAFLTTLAEYIERPSLLL